MGRMQQRYAYRTVQGSDSKIRSGSSDWQARTYLYEALIQDRLRKGTPPGDGESVGGRFAVPLSNLI